ncbi:MAG TPA: hypothetical protein VFC78_13875, partial [Tepidisphaeraceae bacterium]|nr:hypothetical protein [Tepidisphaeraceae bacterium]
IYGPNEARVLQPIGQTIAALANGTYTGPLGEVTDSNNPTADPSTVSYYAASVDWGNNNFVPCTVTADGNGGFTVSGTSPFPLTDPNALITMDVGYASGSPYAGQLSALSTPITLVSQAITNLTATAASTSEIDLAFNLAVSNATGIQVGRSTDGTNFTTIATLAATATTYADTGLSIASHYWYQVSALPLSGDGAMSSIDTYSLPAAATGLSVSMSGGAADLSWTNNDPSAPPYDIEQSPDGVNFTVIDETAAGATTYVDANPTEGIGYYRVDAVNADGTASNPSGIAAVTNAVVPPSDLSAQAVSASEIDLSWTNNSALADGITILCSTDGNTFFTLVALTDPTIETYADTGLAAGTHDFYEVEATKGLIASVPCTEADDTTTPPTPSGLSVTPGATPSSGLNLSWTAAQGAAGYDVQREAAGSAWQTISQLSGGTTTTFADTNLWDGIAYSYQIDAFNNSGTSPMSDIVTSATALTAPNEPTVQACALSLTSAQVVWVNHAYNESSFLIERSQDNGATWTTLGTVAPGADTYIDTGLTPNSSYEYKVTAQNAAGGGAGSAAVVTGIPYIPSNSVQGLQYASELGPDGMPSHGFFEVTRAGDVSQSASLGYTIDTTPPGSATPGYEYQTLSGSVAFSAGQSTALVQLTPREITHVEANTNVTLDIAGGNSTTGVASAGIVNTDGATISMTEAPMDAGEDAPQTLSYLNFYRRPAVATITITSNPSSAMSVDNSPVTTGSDGTGVVQLLGLSAGSVTLHCADPAGNAVDVPEQVDIPQLTITQEKLTFQDPQTKNQIPQTIGKDAGGTYSGMQWNDVFNGAKWTQTRIDEARKTQGYPVAYQVGGTIKMIVNFYVTLGSFKHAPAGTWLVYGTANGPNDPAPFFEGNGTATVSGGAIRVMATLTANEALPETISNSDLDIRWFLGFTPSVGTWTSNADGPDSINHLYVTRGLSKTTLIYETEYDIGCRAATGLIDETQTLNAIWAQFSGDSVVAADDKTVLYYASIGGSSDSDLLKAHKGQCDTWAALLAKTFLAQGIIARRIKVLPPGGYSWIRLYPTSAQGLGANGNFPNPTFRYHYLVEAQDFQTEAFDPSFGGSPATGATLAAIETNFETRVAGVKSTYLANALLTPLSAVPAKHLRYSPGEYLTP